MNITTDLSRFIRNNLSFRKRECYVSIGDIFLKQGNDITETQFIASSRSLDIARYCINGMNDFPYKNTICKAIHGKRHNENISNLKFISLIKSFQNVGYNSSYPIQLNKEGYLIEGNHRCGACIFFKVEVLKATVSRYGRKVDHNIDNFIVSSINDDLIKQVCRKFDNIQEWLIKTGNTFVIKASGFNTIEEIDVFIQRTGYMCTILRTTKKNDNTIIIQFSLSDPHYIWHNYELISVRCIKIERVLKKIYPSKDIIVSKSCYEGRRMIND